MAGIVLIVRPPGSPPPLLISFPTTQREVQPYKKMTPLASTTKLTLIRRCLWPLVCLPSSTGFRGSCTFFGYMMTMSIGLCPDTWWLMFQFMKPILDGDVGITNTSDVFVIYWYVPTGCKPLTVIFQSVTASWHLNFSHHNILDVNNQLIDTQVLAISRFPSRPLKTWCDGGLHLTSISILHLNTIAV